MMTRPELTLSHLPPLGGHTHDTVAERAVAIGTWPDRQAEAIVTGRDLPEVARDPFLDREVVHQLARRISDAAECIRVRRDRMADLDVASHDVLKRG